THAVRSLHHAPGGRRRVPAPRYRQVRTRHRHDRGLPLLPSHPLRDDLRRHPDYDRNGGRDLRAARHPDARLGPMMAVVMVVAILAVKWPGHQNVELEALLLAGAVTLVALGDGPLSIAVKFKNSP